MERDTFDRLVRLFGGAGSRRDALRLFAAGVLAGTVAAEADAAARKHRRGKNRDRTKVRAQQEDPRCPSACNLNCSDKKLGPGVNLTKCNLSRRVLDGVDLSGSNLTRVCFERSSLINAKFRGANVSGACFCGADLYGADFRGSNVTAAQLACATVYCNTILPNSKPAVTCGSGKTCCEGFCVDTQTSTSNCGACGRRCAGTTNPCLKVECVAGQCRTVPESDGTACRVRGETGVCCAAGSSATCVGGTICCSSAQCDPGDTCCDGLCFNLETDFEHCGSCDTACPEGLADSCVAGECSCGGGSICPFPLEGCSGGLCRCGGGLVDCNHDRNCTECCTDAQCRQGQRCVAGTCQG